MIGQSSVDIPTAIRLLRYACMKIGAMPVTITVPKEALHKIGFAIDPSGKSYSDWSELLYSGVKIVGVDVSDAATADQMPAATGVLPNPSPEMLARLAGGC